MSPETQTHACTAGSALEHRFGENMVIALVPLSVVS
jgi:hypothetical protein